MNGQELLTAAREVLTAKQYRVYQLKARGLSNYTIALHLDLSVGTVRDHLRAAERRLRHHFNEHSA